MTDAPAPKPKAKRVRNPRPKAVQAFTPVIVPEGAKAVLSPANQIAFNALFTAFTPEQKSAVSLVLNALVVPPMLDDGYRKFFRFWRVYGPQQNVDNVKL